MDHPSIKILNSELELLTEIDLYTSCRYKRSWQGVGDFEIQIIGYDQNFEVGNIIVLDNDGHKAGIIRSVQNNIGSGITTTVTGQTLDGIATQRVILPKVGDKGYYCVPAYGSEKKYAPAESILKEFARSCLCPTDSDIESGSDAKRMINNLIIAEDLKRGMKTNWLARYDTLSDVLLSISEYCDIGWEIYIDFDRKCFVFDVVTGTDRSADQFDNSRVLVSRDFDDIESLTYTNDASNFKNVAYCGGAGENEERLISKVMPEGVYAESEGVERNEIFIDCGSLGFVETSTEMSLEDEGQHKLQDYKISENIAGDISPFGGFRYGKDWDLGDIVTMIEREIDKTQDLRVSEIEESYEPGSGKDVNVTFGNSPIRLGRIIKSFKSTVR